MTDPVLYLLAFIGAINLMLLVALGLVSGIAYMRELWRTRTVVRQAETILRDRRPVR